MTTRPSVNVNPIANRYASPGERIIEFSANDGSGTGGLISLAHRDDGTLHVHVYRQDPKVVVTVAKLESA